MDMKSWDEVYRYCDSNRESDGFCSVCCSCSGPTYSNLAYDKPAPEGCVVLRGGNYGSCKFVVQVSAQGD